MIEMYKGNEVCLTYHSLVFQHKLHGLGNLRADQILCR